MSKLVSLFAFVAVCGSVALTAPPASAQDNEDDRRAGTMGHVTAYDADNDVIDVDPCPRKGYSWDYVSCGSKFRTKISAKICRDKGQGTHRWLYQVGNNKVKLPQYARCN